MNRDDSATLTFGPLEATNSSTGGPFLLPALTIAWHPDVDRVGQVAPLIDLLERRTVSVQREEPTFFVAGSNVGQPIGHRGMSRESVLIVSLKEDAIELRPAGASAEVEVDGQPLRSSRLVGRADLSTGVILVVARRFVFCLHSMRFPITRLPTMGLLGTSDAVQAVRSSIVGVADSPFAVMIRGESGTGKELVARALHDTSARRRGPFVDVNMALLRGERAAAELFGYERGAFTGATESRPGFFRAAEGGTLFLDEIGLTPEDVQPMLLRVLEDHRVQPLGAAHARHVDVRLVAATDARLEDSVAAGRFQRSLYHRLNGGFTIATPPLRERREDIGLLLVHFLRVALAETGEANRLAETDPRTRPWLSARSVADIVRAAWPGNVRELRALAQELAIGTARGAKVDTRAIVADFLRRQTTTQAGSSSVPSSTPPAPVVRSADISRERLLDALDRAGWNRVEAARILNVSRTTLWRRLANEPDIRRLAELSLAEFLKEDGATGGDTASVAARWGVATELLASRLRSIR